MSITAFIQSSNRAFIHHEADTMVRALTNRSPISKEVTVCCAYSHIIRVSILTWRNRV